MQFLGFLFLICCALEILSIIIAAKLIGGFGVFALILFSFITGSYLISRNAGVSKVLMAGELLRTQGKISFYQMLWPIRLPIAGCLLIIPGFVSDLLAILLLLPFKGKPIANDATQSHFQSFYRQYHNSQANEEIIEGEFVVQPNQNKQPVPPKQLEHK